MKIIIIGAGPAGISCAYNLCKNDHEVHVYEASNYIGGMSRTFDLWGQRVDLGPHRFFSKQPKINSFFNELVGNDYTIVNRQTRIYYRNNFFKYPLKLGNVFKNLPITTIFLILKDYLIQKIKKKKDASNFEEWVTQRFGKKLFEIFFKNYTEKLWGIKCTEIDAEWAAQRIKTLTLYTAIKAAIFGNINNKHKTLIDQFAYPNNGTGVIYERAADYVNRNEKSQVYLKTKIEKVLYKDKRAIGVQLDNGQQVFSDYVVSTMPLTSLVKGIPNIPLEIDQAVSKLYFRNTIVVYLEINSKTLFTDNWLYIHSPNVTHGRITNFRNWCPSLNRGKDTTILCLEFWCFDRDKLWSSSENEVCDIAIEEIQKLKLISKEDKIINSKMIKIPKCYPVYETGYSPKLKRITDYLDTIENLIPIGRYGAFKYNNQDHSILMGLLAADKISNNLDVDLWKINTDTEYQEEGKIKDILIQ